MRLVPADFVMLERAFDCESNESALGIQGRLEAQRAQRLAMHGYLAVGGKGYQLSDVGRQTYLRRMDRSA